MAQNSGLISPIWNHFTKLEKGAKCRYCLATLSYTKSSTSNLKRHLISKHPTVPYKHHPQQKSASVRATSVSDVDEEPRSGQHSESNIPSIENNMFNYLHKPIRPDSKRLLDKIVVEFITQECVPFSIVENKAFKNFVHVLNPNYNLPSRKTVSNALLPGIYNEAMEKCKTSLSLTNCVALTSDGWSNINNDSFMALTGHFIDENFQMQSKLLECSELTGSHTGQQILSWVSNVLQKFEIDDKVVSIVTDNAANMKLASNCLNFPHIPCFAHNLNLTVQHAILNSIQPAVHECKHVIKHLKKSSKASQNLVATQKQYNVEILKLKQDVPTRWNSTFDMMDRFLKNKIPILSCIDTLKIQSNLQSKDWTIIEQSLTALKYFESATKFVSAEKHITLSQIGLLSDVLFHKTSDLLNDDNLHPEVKQLITLLNAGIVQRLQIYRDNQTIWKATFTSNDPRVKKTGFHNEPEKLKKTYDLILSEMLPLQEENGTLATQETTKRSREANLLFDDIMTEVAENSNSLRELVEDKINSYLKARVLQIEGDPLSWWKENADKFPTIHSLAKKILCIPGTSVPSERIFSKAGQIYSEKRTRLLPKKLTDILFLQCNN